MPRLGPPMWDDPNGVHDTILPLHKNIDLGSPTLPFRSLYLYGPGSFTGGLAVTGLLAVTGAATVSSTLTVTGNTTLHGNLILDTLGKGLSIKEGANARMGLATLSGGTVIVSTTAVAAGDRIITARQTVGGTTGDLSAPTASIVDGTSFVITSSSGTDTSTVLWIIVKPA